MVELAASDSAPVVQTRRPDPVIAGVYDPLRRRDREGYRDRLTRALRRFGSVVVYERGPLFVAIALPVDRQVPPADASFLCLLDGYVENLDEIVPGSKTMPPEEAVSAHLRRHGFEAVTDLRGAWALVAWDDASGRGVLARDHLNQRPLFLHQHAAVLYFGTEIAPVLAAAPSRPGPDSVLIAHFLASRGVYQNRTFHDGVRRLPGGHVLHLAGETWIERRPWSLRPQPPLSGTPEELGRQTFDELEAAVVRNVGDAQSVGLLISGGLDSSAVAAAAVAALAERGVRLHGYTAVFPTLDVMDESAFSSALARRLGIGATAVEVYAGSALRATLEHLEAFEMPELTANGFFLRPLGRTAAADGIDVMLTGEGGDEVFATPLSLMADALARGRLREAWQLVQQFPEIAYHGGRRLRLRLLRDYGLYPVLPYRLQRALARRADRPQWPDYLRPRLLEHLEASFDPQPWRHIAGPRWWADKSHMFTSGQVYLGASEHTSRMARLSSYAERHPILSLPLVEHVLRLPPEHGFDARGSRPDLRRAMAGLVPDEIRLRPTKRYFDAVRGLSIRGDIEVIRGLLLDRAARINEYVQPDPVRRLVDTVPRTWGEMSVWSSRMHRLMVLECWLRAQEDPAFPRRLRESADLLADELRFRPL